MKTLVATIFTLIIFLLTSSTFADHEEHNKQGSLPTSNTGEINDAACEDVINVKVNGLVCDFCARALEKVFEKRKDIVGIDVDLDNSLVKITMKPGKTINSATLTKMITDSGYSITSINNGC